MSVGRKLDMCITINMNTRKADGLSVSSHRRENFLYSSVIVSGSATLDVSLVQHVKLYLS